MKKRILASVLCVVLALTLLAGALVACNNGKKDEFSVKFDLGVCSDESVTAPPEQSLESGAELTLPDVTWTGHTLLGWKANGEGDTLPAGSNVKVTADVSYVAQWHTDEVTPTYTVSFELNGASGDIESKTVESGESVTLPTAQEAVWSGHLLWGWSEDGEGEVLAPGSQLSVTKSATYEAQWIEQTAAELTDEYCGTWIYSDASAKQTLTITSDSVEYKKEALSSDPSASETYQMQAYENTYGGGYWLYYENALSEGDDLLFSLKLSENKLTLSEVFGDNIGPFEKHQFDEAVFNGYWLNENAKKTGDDAENKKIVMAYFDTDAHTYVFMGSEGSYTLEGESIVVNIQPDSSQSGFGYGKFTFTMEANGKVRLTNNYPSSNGETQYTGVAELTMFQPAANSFPYPGKYVANGPNDNIRLEIRDDGIITRCDTSSGAAVKYGYIYYDATAFNNTGAYAYLTNTGVSYTSINSGYMHIDTNGYLELVTGWDADTFEITSNLLYVPVESLDNLSQVITAHVLHNGWSGYLYVYKLSDKTIYVLRLSGDSLSFAVTMEGEFETGSIFKLSYGTTSMYAKRVARDADHADFIDLAGEERGKYTGPIGEVELDGFGVAKVEGEERTYTYNAGNNNLTLDGSDVIYKLDLTNLTYSELEADMLKGKTMSTAPLDEDDYYVLTFDGYGTVSGINYYRGSEWSLDNFSNGAYTISDDGATVTLSTSKTKIDKTYTIAANGDVLIADFEDEYGFVYFAVEGYQVPAPESLYGYWQNAETDQWVFIYDSDGETTVEIKGVTSIYSVEANCTGTVLKVKERNSDVSGVHFFALSEEQLCDILDGNEPVLYAKIGDDRPLQVETDLVGDWTTGSGMTISFEADKLTIGGEVMQVTDSLYNVTPAVTVTRYSFTYQGENYYVQRGVARYEYYLYGTTVKQQCLYRSASDAIAEDWYGIYNGTVSINSSDKTLKIEIDAQGIKINGQAAAKTIVLPETNYKRNAAATVEYSRKGIAFYATGLADSVAEGADGDFVFTFDTYDSEKDYKVAIVALDKKVTLKKQPDPIEEPDGFTLQGAWYGGNTAGGKFLRFTVEQGDAEKITVYYNGTTTSSVTRTAASGRYETKLSYSTYDIAVNDDGSITLAGSSTFEGAYKKDAMPEQAELPEDLAAYSRIKVMPASTSSKALIVTLTKNSLTIDSSESDGPKSLTSYSIQQNADNYKIVMNDWSEWTLSNDGAKWNLSCDYGYSSSYKGYLCEWFDDLFLEGSWSYTHKSYMESTKPGEYTTTLTFSKDGTLSIDFGDIVAANNVKYTTTAENTITFKAKDHNWTVVYNEETDTIELTCDYAGYNQCYDGTYVKSAQ